MQFQMFSLAMIGVVIKSNHNANMFDMTGKTKFENGSKPIRALEMIQEALEAKTTGVDTAVDINSRLQLINNERQSIPKAYRRYPKMRFEIACLLALAAVSAYATTGVDPVKPERFLLSTGTISFTTFTVVKYSTTITSTFTSTTSCTTSTAALTTCTIGRRRRGLFYDEAAAQGRDRRGLFYNDEEVENNDGSAFLPSEKNDPTVEVGSTSVDESSVVPLEIEAGFSVPNDSGPNRFLLAIGTSTITRIIVTSTTISLTAFCASTSGFPVCGGAGK